MWLAALCTKWHGILGPTVEGEPCSPPPKPLGGPESEAESSGSTPGVGGRPGPPFWGLTLCPPGAVSFSCQLLYWAEHTPSPASCPVNRGPVPFGAVGRPQFIFPWSWDTGGSWLLWEQPGKPPRVLPPSVNPGACSALLAGGTGFLSQPLDQSNT